MLKLRKREKEYLPVRKKDKEKKIDEGTASEDNKKVGLMEIDDYSKGEILGKGTYGIIYKGYKDSTRLALKHIDRKIKISYLSAINEIHMNNLLFEDEKEMVNYCKLYKVIENPKDLWLIFERGGKTITSLCFDIKGEFVKLNGSTERIYQIRHLPFYKLIQSNIMILKKILRGILQAVLELQNKGIVHRDLKPDNILINYKNGDNDYDELKVIDLGSAYLFEQPKQGNSSTPEYLPPEAIRLLCDSNFNELDVVNSLHLSSLPHSLDTWSVGAIFLELASGFPLWFGYKSFVVKNNEKVYVKGIFSDIGRRCDKILLKQQAIKDKITLIHTLNKFPGLRLQSDDLAMDLMVKMLNFDPMERISPTDALMHPFLKIE